MSKAVDEVDVFGMVEQSPEQLLDGVAQRESQRIPVEFHIHALRFVKDALDAHVVERVEFLESLAQSAVQSELTRCLKKTGRRNMKVRQKPHHRRVGFVELAVYGFGFDERR